jgi:hypothetical protein
VSTDDLVPVLWLCGPAGVGKSTVSWQLYTELADSGARVGFADTDQLCMCYPAPPGDPGRQRVKALNVASIVASFRAAGAQCVIVNGVLDPAGLDCELLPGADVTICRLRARGDEVERRFTAKYGQQADLDEQLREVRNEVRLMDQSGFADACVDTTGVAASAVAALVRAACKGWRGFTGDLPDTDGPPPVQHAGAAAGGRVLLITGPTGVGKSTIGFRLYIRCLAAGLMAGYVDLRQVGFQRPGAEGDQGNGRLTARNLAAIWRNYRGVGATHLIASGDVAQAEFRLYAEQLTGAELAFVRLRAGPDDLRLRIMTRGDGGSWPEPGDQLRGQPASFLARVAEQAAQASGAAQDGGLVIDTTGRSPDQSADLIADAAGWLP